MAWLASDFLAEVRQAAAVASTSGTSPEGLTDSEILRVADREVQTSLTPLMIGVREEWYVQKQSVAFTAGTTQRIRIPARTIAGRVRDIRATVGGVDNRLVRYEPSDKPWVQPLASPGPLTGYYLEGEWIVFLPPPQVSGALDIYYLGRPGRMTVTSTDYRALTAVSSTTLTYATWASGQSTSLDVVRGSSGLGPLIQDLSFSGATTTQVTVSAADSAYCAVGDYLVNSDLTPVVPLPVEMHGVLLARVTAALMRQMGKTGAAELEESNANRLCDLAMDLLTPRVESAVRPGRGRLNWRTGMGSWGALGRWGW